MSEREEVEQAVIDFVNNPNKDPRWANPEEWTREELFGDVDAEAEQD